MDQETYLISEAEKLTGEKAHVLRYWEEELGLTIGRNPMGHRYYTAKDIQIFLGIKELKKKGLHLRAIKELIPKLSDTAEGVPADAGVLAVAEGGEEIVCEQTVDCQDVAVNEKREQFYEILDRLIRQIAARRREEERCRRVDEAIRRHQQGRREAAAALEQKEKNKNKKKRPLSGR